MKSFQFRLQKVLRVREQEVSWAEVSHAEARLKARMAREALAKAQEARTCFETELEERCTQRIQARELQMLSHQHEALVQVEEAAVSRLHQALGAVARERQKLVAAQQRKKALEMLEDRQREAYLKEAEAYQQAELDEMAQRICDRKEAVWL